VSRPASLLAEPGVRDRLECPAGETRLLLQPAPPVPAERLLASAAGDGYLWAPPGGAEWAGVGECLTLTAPGEARFASIRRQAEPVWRGLRVEGGDGAPSTRLFGGFAFQPGGAEQEHWRGFGDARFVLPRYSYVRDGERAWLGLALVAEDTAEARERWLLEWERLGSALAQVTPAETAPVGARVLSRDEPSAADWTRLVDGIRAGIAAGRVEKVVAARRLSITLEPAPDPVSLLARLRRVSPSTTRFAFRRGAATFLGATPERLLARRGLSLETEALAGSIRPGPATARRLLASGKDHHEHELVVRDLLRVLEPLARSLEYSGQPRVQELRHVLHLRTPVLAELREPHHVLELVERLHPTPAVGGVPRTEALAWIAEHERRPRGWYAGPVGWFDAAGDGEFSVALRSGLLLGSTAHLYAGGGIVADSDAAGELAETQLKLAALLDALTGSDVDPAAPPAGGE
jgi:menaquinone-specific isochorismate synthase